MQINYDQTIFLTIGTNKRSIDDENFIPKSDNISIEKKIKTKTTRRDLSISLAEFGWTSMLFGYWFPPHLSRPHALGDVLPITVGLLMRRMHQLSVHLNSGMYLLTTMIIDVAIYFYFHFIFTVFEVDYCYFLCSRG